jgi:hypothetical protein
LDHNKTVKAIARGILLYCGEKTVEIYNLQAILYRCFFYGIAGKLQQWKQELPGVGREDMVFSG